MDFRLDGAVAVVTGASRGLGRAIAQALLAEGVNVLAAARSKDALLSLTEGAGGSICPLVCDARDLDAVEALPTHAVEEFGRVDILVNNAGVAPAAAFNAVAIEQWQAIFDVNVFAPVALMRGAERYFREQRSGKVINIGSLSSLRGKAFLSAYSASKGALLRLTESLSAEWAPLGVQVNMIAPGAFATEAQRAVLEDDAVRERRLRKIPAHRFGDSDEIGALACYLASPLSDFVSGSCYTIDGGELAKL